MSTAFKYLVPLALLVGGVFAVTYFSRYTPTEPDAGPGGGTAGGAGEAAGARPLVFFTTERRWNPQSRSLQDQIFSGFFEVGDETRAAAFWFENRNPDPVTVQLKAISCSACSGGRVAPIPPGVTRELLQVSAAGLLPAGLTTGLAAVGVVGPAARFDAARPDLKWQAYTYADHAKDLSQVQYAVPGAANADGWSPQWGILEVNFKVKPNPSLPLTADFVSRIGATDQVGADRFSVFYRPASAVEIDRDQIDLPELSAASPERAAEFVAFSTVRPTLAPPTVRVDVLPGASGEPGGFVTAGPPVPLAPAELDALAARLSEQAKGEPVRVRAAYRVPVVARSRAGNQPADVGRLDRAVYVAAEGDSRRVVVRTTVRGSVYLSDGAKEVAFGSIRSAQGRSEVTYITTEDPDTPLTWVKEQTAPAYLGVELERLPARGDRGQYKLRITIPKNELVGELRGGVVVLDAGGKQPVRVRLPVTAYGAR